MGVKFKPLMIFIFSGRFTTLIFGIFKHRKISKQRVKNVRDYYENN